MLQPEMTTEMDEAQLYNWWQGWLQADLKIKKNGCNGGIIQVVKHHEAR
jgi:hypothetical protein